MFVVVGLCLFSFDILRPSQQFFCHFGDDFLSSWVERITILFKDTTQ